jgi:hypothetical protein
MNLDATGQRMFDRWCRLEVAQNCLGIDLSDISALCEHSFEGPVVLGRLVESSVVATWICLWPLGNGLGAAKSTSGLAALVGLVQTVSLPMSRAVR